MRVVNGKRLCWTRQSFVAATVIVFAWISLPISNSSALSIHNRIKRGSPLESLEEVLVVTPTASTDGLASKMNNSKLIPPEIYSFRVESFIKYRYSRTLVTSRVVNKDADHAQEVTFSVILPETAFISKFIMEIDGTAYEAYVKEKEQAKRDYLEAQRRGQSAGLVEKSTRNSNVLNVNVHVKQQTKVTFNLTYEEMLARKLGRYEQAINISPDQILNINDYQITVNIEESRDLKFVRVPSLNNDTDALDNEDNPDVIIERSPNKAKITWSPTSVDQTRLQMEGNSGKFLVQYDVDRKADAGEILLMQGYFVHFFAPENLPPLRKHIVFVLDISSSMSGRRLEQLKESQRKILEDLSPDDYFNIITFSSDVGLWSPERNRYQPLPASPDYLEKARGFIETLRAKGGTNIHDGLAEALNLIATAKDAQRLEQENKVRSPALASRQVVLPPNVHPLILFLTDGEPTAGVTNPTEIINRIRFANENSSIPIYSLGFGEGVDFPFLKRLSLQNFGFGRKIYEAADAALQLEGFYAEISSPLLSNVTFNYTSVQYNVTDLTVTRFPMAFGGAEIAVAGKLVALTKSNEVDGSKMDEAAIQDPPQLGSPIFVLNSSLNGNSDSGLMKNQVISCNVGKLERCYFNIDVGGTGREGKIDLHHVDVFEGPAWSEVDIDFPKVSSSPIDPPSPEDKFLEKLWAYLTISQLIEKDSSGVGEVSPADENPLTTITGTPETSKQKALRLALKYGFVTPLTSLVVVKPNSSSSISNVVPVDGHDSLESYRIWLQEMSDYKNVALDGDMYYYSRACQLSGSEQQLKIYFLIVLAVGWLS